MDAKRFPEAVLESLDDPKGLASLPRRTAQSRSQVYRLFQAMLDESPGAMRRRLLLERSAWELGHTRQAVTEIALNAGYGALEAFTRAFRAAYGLSPSLYRRSGVWRIHLPAPNGFHYGGPAKHKGAPTDMDLFDLFAGTDSWYTRKLLDEAGRLSDAQLDEAQPTTARVFGWEKPDQNLREILERMVITKEVWVAALTKGPIPEIENPSAEERTPRALRERFERADTEFNRLMREIRDRGTWDETFVDTLCNPPETFSFGGTFAHVITFNAQRRMAALDAFHRLGVPITGVGCPMEYEAAHNSTERFLD
ncbi:MAG: AraC family transcriptional regulator [Acidobacteriota bacterium]